VPIIGNVPWPRPEELESQVEWIAMPEGHISIPEEQINVFLRELTKGNDTIESLTLRCQLGHFQATCDVRVLGLRQHLALDISVVDFEVSMARQIVTLNFAGVEVSGRNLVGKVLHRLVHFILNRLVRSKRAADMAASRSDNLVTLEWPAATLHLNVLPAVQSAIQQRVGDRPLLDLLAFTRCQVEAGCVLLFFEPRIA
jgi:hypothetical protein